MRTCAARPSPSSATRCTWTSAAMRRWRDCGERLARRNLKLLLDFVPNHVAPDHPWVDQHPEFFIEGTEDDLAREPQNWGRFSTSRGSRVLAYGRDPYFPGWPDTVQLNYQHAGLREAMLGELGRVASRCDGVRCDMAMLIQPEVFRANLGRSRQAARRLAGGDAAVLERRHRPDPPEAPGFRVRGRGVLGHGVGAAAGRASTTPTTSACTTGCMPATARRRASTCWPTPDFQDHSLRFLENHDEPRAAAAFSPASTGRRP